MASNRSVFSLFVSEFVGTALLLLVGLSIVIFFWGKGSPVPRIITSLPLRRAINGFLFGTTGCLITISPVGKVSGAHINPAVSTAFWLRGKMKLHAFVGYMISQMAGAAVGSIPLLLWGSMGRSVEYGNTVPGNAGIFAAFVGEMVTTAMLILVIFVFSGSKKLRPLTPFTMPFLYSVMVWIESPLSGCSTNPARSFGPALVSRIFTAYWLYWAAPIAGVVLVICVFYAFRLHHYYQLKNARVSYHDAPTHESIRNDEQGTRN